MLLACDIGNSSSSFGVFDDKNNIIRTFRTNTAELTSVSKLKKFFSENVDLKDIKGISVSSVVPSADPIYKEFFSKIKINPFFISSTIKLNIKICIESHEKVGSDRIANICYAHFINQKFQIVIDMGTALTIDVVDEKGNFLGGIIYPGIPLLSACLYQSTEKLPLLDIVKTERSRRDEKSKTLIGINTETAIISGIYNGNIFLIKGFANSIADYYNRNLSDVNVIFTGGNSDLFFKDIDIKANKILDANFTLKGIEYLYDLNKN